MNINKININQSELTYNIASDNGYLYAGIATPTTNPSTLDVPVFYVATTAGTYTNFSDIEIADGEAVILQWNNGAWTKKTTELATILKLNNEIHTNNKISPFVLINKYSMTENGWYDN